MVGSSGCGPIGLYSLGHSLLVHNHVLKPILPDGPGEVAGEGVEEGGNEQGVCAPAGSGAQKGSSCGHDVPIQIAHPLSDAAYSLARDETEGN